jgi:hypothetical protein
MRALTVERDKLMSDSKSKIVNCSHDEGGDSELCNPSTCGPMVSGGPTQALVDQWWEWGSEGV